MANPVFTVIHGAGLGDSVDPRICTESHGVFRLRRIIEPPLAAQACLLHTRDSLDRVEALITRFNNRPVSADDAYLAHFEFLHGLIAPAASEWDLRTLGSLWWEFSQQIRGAVRLLPSKPHAFAHGRTDDRVHRPLVTAYRTGDPAEAAAATHRYIDRFESATMSVLARASQAPTSPPSMGAGA